jgi:SnoaL-like protein
MDSTLLDKLAIRELLENWAVWRDSADWTRFRTVWHDDGYMMATWFQGSADEFIAISRAGFARGVNILHFLGGSSIDLAGTRAIAQTKMTISQRAMVHHVEVDVLCTGRFYDFLEKRDGKWGVVTRRVFYEKDRMDPVNPSQTVDLDPAVLAQFPVGYRNLAYLQSSLGFKVKLDLPGLKGAAGEKLYAYGQTWLAGGNVDGVRD